MRLGLLGVWGWAAFEVLHKVLDLVFTLWRQKMHILDFYSQSVRYAMWEGIREQKRDIRGLLRVRAC